MKQRDGKIGSREFVSQGKGAEREQAKQKDGKIRKDVIEKLRNKKLWVLKGE